MFVRVHNYPFSVDPWTCHAYFSGSMSSMTLKIIVYKHNVLLLQNGCTFFILLVINTLILVLLLYIVLVVHVYVLKSM